VGTIFFHLLPSTSLFTPSIFQESIFDNLQTINTRVLLQEEIVIPHSSQDQVYDKNNEIQNPVEIETEQFSLSVMRQLSTFGIEVRAMVLSKDQNYVYVIEMLIDEGLRIIDISNIKAPVTVSIMSLDFERYSYANPGLYLSEDGKTLFGSTFQNLFIIDVSDVKSPFFDIMES